MASSQHRPGAKVSLSPASYAKEQLKRVENLETQLEQLPPKKSDDQASRLRMRLCELVSDIILTDPLFALQNDCIGRLWRSCFYGPIGTLRARISREKRKKGPNVAKLEKSLSRFLTEAITLYEYLISQYHGKLLPSQFDASMTPDSQESQTSTGGSQPPPSTNPAGVIPGLFRMYIHMGDLYRYESNYHKAQQYYYNAAKLSPGRGNPYNQLAVVAQLKDAAAPLNAVALFWYARSLLTTHEPFEISKANLARLFQSNRDWFRNQPPPPEEALKAANGNGGREMIKAQRTLASRYFLSQFVDLHFSFFQGLKSDDTNAEVTNGNSEKLLNDHDVVKQIEAILTLLSVLLGACAFGDSLLCKMVVICAFSEAYHPNTDESQKKQGDTLVLARMFTLAFASCLAERAAVGLSKIQEQPEKMGMPGKAPPSVRLLLPLLLACEYIESAPFDIDFDQTSLSHDTRSFCETTVDTFWQRVSEVMNLLTNLRGPLGLNSGQSWDNSYLKEYTNLIGFSPFQGFLDDPRASSREDGFASIEEAVEVLELNQSSTQESSTLQTITPGSPFCGAQSVEEYKVKVARFLAFGDRMADTNDPTTGSKRRFERSPDGSYLWIKNADIDMEEVDGNDIAMMDEEDVEENDTQPPNDGKADEGGDVLVYSIPEGGGPALLVPGMMLQHRALTGISGENEPRNSAGGNVLIVGAPIPALPGGLGVSVDPSNPARAPPASVKPPPGFGAGSVAPAATMPLAGMAQQDTLVLDGNYRTSGYASLMPHDDVAGLTLGFGQGFSPVTQQHAFEPTIGTSMNFFGGPDALKTGNPFAAASTPAIDANGNLMLGLNMDAPGTVYTQAGSFLNQGVSGGGGDTLFGSGLLSSLFEDAGDQRTRNPFAT